MTERFEKSIRTLELPRVLELLAHHAVSQEAKERALALRPATELEDVQRLQAETAAAVAMSNLGNAPGFGDLKPVAASLQRASLGGALNPNKQISGGQDLRRHPL